MSGFGTAKVQTNSVRLGFPIAVEDAMARDRFPSRYMPSAPLPKPDLPVGHDLQAQWHEQKKKDADYMARQKVISTQKANVRAFSSHMGYFGMPKPVLGQRKFANPSMGNQADIYSARRDVFSGSGYPAMNVAVSESGSLEGGVLRTTAGQAYGKARLTARIGQLKAIEEAKQSMLTGEPSTAFVGRPPASAEMLDSIPQVELAQVLRTILNALAGRQKEGYANIQPLFRDSTTAFKLIVQLATTNSAGDITNVLQFIEGGSGEDGILQLLEGLIENIADGGIVDDEALSMAYNQRNPGGNVLQLLITLKDFWTKITIYLKRMLAQAKGGDIPLKDRETLSKSLIASLGFKDFLNNIANVQSLLPQAQQDMADRRGRGDFGGDGNSDDDDDGDDDDGDGYGSVHTSQQSRVNRMLDYAFRDSSTEGSRPSDFSRPARGWFDPLRRREDAEHGSRRPQAQFSSNTRDVYAYSSGQYQDNTGGRPRGFAGEEEVDYGEAPEQLVADTLGEVDGADGVDAREMGVAVAGLQPGGLGFSMSSRFDPHLGGYDVDTGRRPTASASSASAAVSPPPATASLRPTLKPQGFESRAREAVGALEERPGFVEPSMGTQRGVAKASGAYPYSETDVPRDLVGLRRFINMLNERHDNYSQSWYAKADVNPKNVRRNTIRKMREAGLLR